MNSYRYLAQVYDSLMYDVDVPAWSSYLCELLKSGGVPHRARILETACGTGNITLPLVRAGYDVVALDISEDMLREAQEKLRKAAAGARFVCGDMRSFTLEGVWAVVCACDGVNYLTGDGDAKRFFEQSYRNLKPGGKLLFDISSYKKLTQTIGNNVFFDDGEDVTSLWRNSLSNDIVKMELTLFIRQGKLFSRMDEEHVQRAYKIEEIKQLLSDAGFKSIACTDFGTKENATEECQRIQFAAVKEI